VSLNSTSERPNLSGKDKKILRSQQYRPRPSITFEDYRRSSTPEGPKSNFRDLISGTLGGDPFDGCSDVRELPVCEVQMSALEMVDGQEFALDIGLAIPTPTVGVKSRNRTRNQKQKVRSRNRSQKGGRGSSGTSGTGWRLSD
jgi:hypothetical protein